MATPISTARHVAIEPFKRNEYDRGSKVILVDGEKWGEYRMESHGMHGPSYHASDLHGPLYTGVKKFGRNKGDGIEHSFRPTREKDVRRNNLYVRDDDKKKKFIPTDEQLRLHAIELIESGVLRSPVSRNNEITAAHAKYVAERERAEERADTEFKNRADAAIGLEVTNTLAEIGGHDIRARLRERIIEAMRWAQTQ